MGSVGKTRHTSSQDGVRPDNGAGFTLLEVLVATVLIGVISVAAMQLFTSTVGVQHKLTKEFDMRLDGQMLLGQIQDGFEALGERYGGALGATVVVVSDENNRLLLQYGDEGTGYTVQYFREEQELKRRIRDHRQSGSIEWNEIALTNVESFVVTCAGSTVRILLEIVGGGTPRPREVLETSLRPRLARPQCE